MLQMRQLRFIYSLKVLITSDFQSVDFKLNIKAFECTIANCKVYY